MYTQENSKTYTGTKTLKAWPATRGEYNAYRGWTMPEGEDPSEGGYLVEYTDGGKPNHPNHDGYISWSPADVFHNAYIETPGNWHTRLVEEAGQVAFRLDKLDHFLMTGKYMTLPEPERALLSIQRTAMQQYLSTLEQRIDRDGDTRPNVAPDPTNPGPAGDDAENPNASQTHDPARGDFGGGECEEPDGEDDGEVGEVQLHDPNT